MNKLGTPPKRSRDHVAVLKGGLSAEREVSLRSGAAVAEALRSQGYTVTEIDVGRDLSEQLMRVKPQACFNALHGKFGEDGCVQGVLEFAGLPYTHSGVMASAIAMDKEMAKRVFEGAGLRMPEGKIVHRSVFVAGHPMRQPYVVKPIAEGSSVGVIIVREGANISAPDMTNLAPSSEVP